MTPNGISDETPATAASLIGGFERAGTYDVTVSVEGYEVWSASSITVASDECHVITEMREAAMVPMRL